MPLCGAHHPYRQHRTVDTAPHTVNTAPHTVNTARPRTLLQVHKPGVCGAGDDEPKVKMPLCGAYHSVAPTPHPIPSTPYPILSTPHVPVPSYRLI
eukprot:7672892-Pyramimonas_sp.AAC.1